MIGRGVEKAAETAGDVKDRADWMWSNTQLLGAHIEGRDVDEMNQMGARRIGSLAIGIAVVAIVINEMSNLEVVNESDGVVNVDSIFETAGSGLNLLVLGVIIAAAAVLLNLWSGF